MATRRQFLQSSLCLALAPLLPRLALSATTVRVRPDWETFRSSPLFPVFVRAIGAMRANLQSADPASWLYWVDVHKQACPHRLPYFLAWHRGFLRRFEIQLRRISGRADLVLPYWDYYRDPRLPVEFNDDASPLWRPNRVGDNVAAALTLDPFDDRLIRFPRGRTDAFEPVLETAPHNPVHNLIGGAMANVSISPLDPVFWVHHANIDRLWVAWVNAGGSRRMPAATNSYWSGYFHYGSAVPALPRLKTRDTLSLGYRYQDPSPPQMPSDPYGGAVSALGGAASTDPLAPGEARPLSLGEASVGIAVQLGADARSRVRSMLIEPASTGRIGADTLTLVLDDVRLAGRGKSGGYFYRVLLGLPAPAGGLRAPRYVLLDTLGPFEIGAARMRMRMGRHAAMGVGPMGAESGPLRLAYPLGDALRKLQPDSLERLSVAFVRADAGGNTPRGEVITVGALRMELASP